jgi:hypothetical protein
MDTYVTHSEVSFVCRKHPPTNGKWKVFKNTRLVKRRVRQEYVNVSDHENSKSWRCETPARMIAYCYLGATRIPA